MPPGLLRRCWSALGVALAIWGLVVSLLWASRAWADSGDRAVYHKHTFTLANAACPTGSPGTAPDGYEWGISTSKLQGWSVIVCPEAGAHLTGAGSLKVCMYSRTPWGPGQWALAPRFTWIMTADDETTADNPCVSFETTETLIGMSDRIFVYPSTDFGVSAGTTLDVWVIGAQKLGVQ